MVEYLYVWDRKMDKCVAVWFVKSPALAGKEPKSCRGGLEEDEVEEHVKKLVKQYPEPRYVVEGDLSEEHDGLKAAAEILRLRQIESEEEEE